MNIEQVIMSIAMALLLGIFIIFPLKERVTNAKQVKTLSLFSSLFSCFVLTPRFCHFQDCYSIKLLESPIPTPAAPTPTPSQKAHFDNISGTKRGSIDPLVSKRPEKNSE